MFRGHAALALAIAFALLGASDAHAGTLVAPWVKSQGTAFVDQSGDEVVLRGFNVLGPTAPALWTKTVDLGANFVRLPVTWSKIEPTAPVGGVHTYDEALLAAFDNEIAFFQAHGVNVMLDFHQIHWSPFFANDGAGIPAWFYTGKGYARTEMGRAVADWYTDPAGEAGYKTFVTKMVRRYRSFPNVVGYQVLNESWGGKLGNTHAATQTVLSWQARIRSTIVTLDPLRTVFVDARGGGNLGLKNADFSVFGSLANLAVDLHSYFTADGSGYTADGENWRPSYFATHNWNFPHYAGTEANQEELHLFHLAKTRALGIPLVVGEWGIPNRNSAVGVFQRQLLNVFARHNISWTRWDLGNDRTFGLLKADGTYRYWALQLSEAIKTPRPVNTVAPSASGATAVGATMTVTNGSWSPASGLKFTYQWSRCDILGMMCSVVPGATGKTYVTGAADVGSTLRATVTAMNLGGSTGATSNAIGPVVPA